MKRRREYISGPVVLSLVLVTGSVLAAESVPDSGFTYTDDWAVVSAPPPPGPYRAVNIDPRVPGVDDIPPLSLDKVSPPARQDIPADALANAPAAGIPANRMPQDRPAAALDAGTATQTVTPARMGQVPPAPPSRFNYPAPPRYPAQTRAIAPYGYPAYRNQNNYGYGAPAYRQGQPQVPPPPMYDSYIRNQQPYGYPPGKGTP